MVQDLILCLQEAALTFILKKHLYPTDPCECFVNPDCGCPHPGQELQCEDCCYLEGCLSSFKLK